MTEKPMREWDRLILRLPEGMKAEVENVAAANCRTLNGQLVFAIKRGLAAERAIDSGGTVYAKMKREEALRG